MMIGAVVFGPNAFSCCRPSSKPDRSIAGNPILYIA
jgi:hypothetical protein